MAKSKKTKKASKPAKARAKAAKPKPKSRKTVQKKAAAKPAPAVVRVQAKPDTRRRPKSLVRRAADSVRRGLARIAPRLRGGKYDADLERNPANYQPLTPLTFLERAASVFGDRIAIVHGAQRFTYAQYYAR